MNNIQQETLKYFNRHAKDWAKNANAQSLNKVNVIRQRNGFVLKVINERKKTNLFLDIGCGTGDLVCQIASKGINAIGIDFSKEMIDMAKNKAEKSKYTRTTFKCCTFFDFSFEPDTYDVISANGFIEYISYKELNLLLSLCRKALKRNGSLVLGSRNRLFNVFSLNEFTKEEISTGNINQLIIESIELMISKNIKELASFKPVPLQKRGKNHPNTGIDVSTRYQYTPVQLINILKKSDFKTKEIYPVHIHGIPPNMKDKYPAIHRVISNYLQEWSNRNERFYLIPQSSSFMIHAIKK